MTTKKFINASDVECKFEICSRPDMAPTQYHVKPGESCDIPLGYTSGSFLERRAPGLVPADEYKGKPAPKAEPKPEPKAEAKPEPKEEAPAESEEDAKPKAKKSKK